MCLMKNCAVELDNHLPVVPSHDVGLDGLAIFYVWRTIIQPNKPYCSTQAKQAGEDPVAPLELAGSM